MTTPTPPPRLSADRCPGSYGDPPTRCGRPEGHAGECDDGGVVWVELRPPALSSVAERIRRDQREPVDPSAPVVIMVSREAPAPSLDAYRPSSLEQAGEDWLAGRASMQASLAARIAGGGT